MFDLDRLSAHPFLARLEYRDEVASTNDLAAQLLGGETLPTATLVLAAKQTAGRGRGANRWWSAEGGLTFSIVVDPAALGIPPERWPQVALASAVALVTALEDFAPRARFGVKWPNDVHADGRKISGILTEAPNAAKAAARQMIVGIGLNVNNSWGEAPAELQAVGTSLADLSGGPHDRTEVLEAVLTAMAERLDQLARQDARLPAAWRSLCVLTGKHVEVDLGQRLVAGICTGLDHDGALLLDTPGGPERLVSGVVRTIRS